MPSIDLNIIDRGTPGSEWTAKNTGIQASQLDKVKEKQCKLLYIHDRLFNLPGAVNLHDVTPGQWLGLFTNADYVVTNSFHGTVFSINFNKQFFVRFIPRSIANTRIQCVLEEYGLFHREIDSLDNTRCEYQTANTILAKNREHSLEFLRNRIIGV